jgi:hypothetical protein
MKRMCFISVETVPQVEFTQLDLLPENPSTLPLVAGQCLRDVLLNHVAGD